jgi:hypothetical protein
MTKISLEIHPNRNREKYGSFKESLAKGLSISTDHELVDRREEAELIICADCSGTETAKLREDLQPGQELIYAVPDVAWRGFAAKRLEFSRYAKVVIEQDLLGRLGLESRRIFNE